MPKAKTNKERKRKLEQFKTKEKAKFMAKQMPQFKPFNQVPVWEDTDKFEITSKEFTALKNFLNIFSEPMAVMQDIFTRHIDSGVVKIKYEDKEGNEIPKEEIESQMKQFNEYLSSMRAEELMTRVETTPHDVTQDDLDNNPELVGQVNVSEEIGIPIES